MVNRKEEISTEMKIQMLKDIVKIFKKNKIDYFLTYGTLLGIVRDKKILPWDEDIDIGLWNYNYEEFLKLEKEFEKKGYRLIYSNRKYTHVDICFKKDYVTIKENINVEFYMPFHAGICFSVKDKDKAIVMQFFDENFFNNKFSRLKNWLIDKKNNAGVINNLMIKTYNFFSRIYSIIILFTLEKEVMPSLWFEKLDTIKAYGIDLCIPSNSDKYLELTYGINWKKPDPKFRKDFSKLNKLAFQLLRRKLEYGTKRRKSNAYTIRYQIRDKKVRDLWIKRGDILVE